MEREFKTSVKLSIMIALLATIASIGGILWEGLYQDSQAIQAVWFVNDMITLFIAIPLLLASMYFSLKGSKKAQLIWVGSLWYLLYNYVFYLYGAAFNRFFLLYVLLFTLPAFSLVLTLSAMDAGNFRNNFSSKTPTRPISIFLFIFALALGIPWVIMALGFIFSNQAPPFEMTIVFATDLSFLVSVLIFSAILLWKQNSWGYVLAAMIMLKGLLYPLVLIIGGALSYYRTGAWDSFIPLYFTLWLLCTYYYRMLLRSVED